MSCGPPGSPIICGPGDNSDCPHQCIAPNCVPLPVTGCPAGGCLFHIPSDPYEKRELSVQEPEQDFNLQWADNFVLGQLILFACTFMVCTMARLRN